MLTTKEEAEELKLALNRFLRVNRAMVCTRDGGLVKKSVWFVATHWPELTVSPGPKQGAKASESPVADVVTDEAATASPTTMGVSATPLDVFKLSKPPAPAAVTEERSEEEMTPTFTEPVIAPVEDDDDVVEHECRKDGCDEKFEGVHWRATHEMKHGFRVNMDGTVTSFDPNAPTPDEEEVQNLIIKVCRDQEPMNQAQIEEAVRTDTPTAKSPTIKIILQILTDDGWFELVKHSIEGKKGHTRRYKYLGEPVKKARKKVTKPLAEAVDETIDKLTENGGFMETAISTVRGENDQSRVERYRSLIEELLADLAEIDDLRDQIKRMEQSNELLEAELKRTAKERDDAWEKAKTIGSEELARVTAERDELQGKLDTLKQIFN
jgi:hypothetical protein